MQSTFLVKAEASISLADQAGRTQQPSQFVELNALRGIAASIVILYHFRLLYPIHGLSASAWLLWNGLLRIFFSGPESVIFFFILSGFVLSLPFIRGKSQPYGTFVIRRICRIYLPYLGALLIGVFCAAAFHGQHLPLVWAANTWSEPVNRGLVLAHILFLGDYQNDQFDTVFWSLIVEMRLSLLFPIFCLLVRKLKPRMVLPGLAALSVAGMVVDHKWPMQSQPWLTLHYAAMFGLGILTADNLRKLSSFYLSLRKITRKGFIAGGLFLFSFGTMGTMGSPRFGYGYMNGGEWVVAAGCLVLMIASLNSISVSGFLSSGVPQWLGKISYSLYLLHSMVMFGLLHLLYGRIPLLAILPISLAGTLVLSWLFYLLIESPSMRLSRRIGARRTAPRETSIPKKALVTELAER